MPVVPFGMPDVGLWMPVAGVGMPVAPLGMPDVGLGMPDVGLGMPDVGLGMPDVGLWVPGIGLEVPGVGLRVPGVGLGMPDVGLGMPDAGLAARAPLERERSNHLPHIVRGHRIAEPLPPEVLLVVERVLHERIDLDRASLDGRERRRMDVQHPLISPVREAWHRALRSRLVLHLGKRPHRLLEDKLPVQRHRRQRKRLCLPQHRLHVRIRASQVGPPLIRVPRQQQEPQPLRPVPRRRLLEPPPQLRPALGIVDHRQHRPRATLS
jgi:hypothetical protein